MRSRWRGAPHSACSGEVDAGSPKRTCAHQTIQGGGIPAGSGQDAFTAAVAGTDAERAGACWLRHASWLMIGRQQPPVASAPSAPPLGGLVAAAGTWLGTMKEPAMDRKKWVEPLYTYGPYAAAVLF